MVMNARSTSFGSWKSSFRISISTTSAPNERSAFATPRPVASETSRSDPGPPISTVIFFGNSSRVVNQLKYFRRCGVSIVHDEIAVHLRDARISDARILQPEFIHQFARWNAGG